MSSPIVTEVLADGTVISGPAHEVQAALAQREHQQLQQRHAQVQQMARTGGVVL